MKALMTIAIAVSFPLLSYADEPGPVGRYQLLAARDPIHSDLTDIWKIDTVTGQVWRFTPLDEDINANKSKGGFIPVDTAKP